MTGSVLLFAQLTINPPIRLTNSLEVRLWESQTQLPFSTIAGVPLFVGHGEDAVPAGGRLLEEIFLAALPVGA
jgi:hypothetical protein